MAKKKSSRKTKRRKAKSKKKGPGLFRRAFKLCLVLGIWAGLFVAGLVAWYASELPDIIEAPQFERKASIRLLGRDGQAIGRYGELRGMSVNVSELPPHMIYAVLAIEDRRFYQHFGIDPLGIARAMVVNIRAGDIVQGGSTITQQLAKNLFLSHDRTLKRKVQEALLALWLERELTKDEILSAYLNRVYLGSGAYGIDAAARLYFNKPATNITLKESALLAGLLKAPSRYSPHSNPKLAKERAATVLHAMEDAGYIENTTGPGTLFADGPKPGRKPVDTDTVSYFTDWVIAGLDGYIGTPDQDLVVTTTLDPHIQSVSENALQDILNRHGDTRNISQGAIVLMGRDGAVLAMVGGKDFQTSQFNRATQALRPPGSAFKPVVYYTALAQGKDRDSTVLDSPLETGSYKPENFKNEYHGPVTFEEALAESMNTAAVRVARETGISDVISSARTMGIKAPLSHDLSLALGSSGIPVIEMATAYTTIANKGYRTAPYSILKIETGSGDILYKRMPLKPQRPALDHKAVRELQHMLETVIQDGTGKKAFVPGLEAGGKTGTSQGFRDAWFIGYTSEYIAAVWLGNDDNSPMDGVTGGSYPAMIWASIMKDIHKRPARPPTIFASSDNDTASSPFRSLLQSLLGQE